MTSPQLDKPTIAIVPGAWHSPAHMGSFVDILQSAGYPAVAHKLASVGIENGAEDATAAADAQDIRENLLLPLLSQGKSIILCSHSYSGLPASAAALGLSSADRAEAGQPGGVIGLLCVTAFLAAEGQSVESSMSNKQLSPWVKSIPNTGNTIAENPVDVFATATDPAVAARAASLLQTSSLASLSTPSPAPGWATAGFEGRRAYVRCGADICIPPVAQTAMIEMSGVHWDVLDLPGADHLPWYTYGNEMRVFIDKLAAQWR